MKQPIPLWEVAAFALAFAGLASLFTYQAAWFRGMDYGSAVTQAAWFEAAATICTGKP